jgi:hypothetical protein
MAYLVSQLISNAYFLSGVVSRGLEAVGGEQMSDGLTLLNALLAIKTANNRLIPYYSEYETTTVVGQETYFVPNLIDIEAITFNIQTVRFSMLERNRRFYFGAPRVDNINALPFDWHMERTLGGANVYLYFLPNAAMPLKIFGKFSLAEVELDDDLSETLDLFYIEYLRYALTEYICGEYQISVQPQVQQKLNEYEKIIRDISPIDLTIQKASTLTAENGLNWAMVNFPGWTP